MSSSHAYPHEPTGVETRKLGMWVFLSTEILFFGNLGCHFDVNTKTGFEKKFRIKKIRF